MIDANLTPTEMSKRGIAAAKAGRNEEAREYLLAAVEADERNEAAWLWLGGLMPELEDQIVCLENALHLNPDNAPAATKLKKLYAKRETTPTPALSPEGRGTTDAAPADAFTAAPPVTPFSTPAANPVAPANPFTATPPANPFSTPVNTVAPANPFTANPPPASPFAGNPPVPAVTQVMPDPPFGALPWDSFTATYGDSGNVGNVPADNAATSINPFNDNTSSVPRYQPGGHPEQRGHTAWEQPSTAQMYSYASEANPTEDYLASAIAGGQYVPPSQADWNSQASDASSAFISDAPATGYADFNSGNSSYVSDAADAGYTAASYRDRYGDTSASFDIPELDHDERLDCPYCGWHTNLADERCPNCEGELYLHTRLRETRSSALWTLVTLWMVRALKSAFNLGAIIVLTNIAAKSLAGSGLSNSGFTPSSLNESVHRLETFFIIYYGIFIVVYAIMAFGSWARVRVFYYINLAILVLSVIAALASYAFDQLHSPISLVVDLVLIIIQFVMVVRCEPDFIPQKQRIMEPSYHGEASALGFFNLGTQYQKAGYTALAAKAWRRSVGLSPGETRSRVALATAYNKMKRYDLAVSELQQAMKIDPNEARFFNLMAITQMRMGDFAEARRYIALAHELKPNNPDTLDTEKLIEDEAKKAAGKSKPAPAAAATNK